MILQIKLELTYDELKQLANMAHGYLRTNPRVRWKTNEYKEHARVAVQQIITTKLHEQALNDAIDQIRKTQNEDQ